MCFLLSGVVVLKPGAGDHHPISGRIASLHNLDEALPGPGIREAVKSKIYDQGAKLA